MFKHVYTLARLGAAALCVIGASTAFAVGPQPATKPLSDAENPRLSEEERTQAKQHEAFEKKRTDAAKTTRYLPPARPVDPAAKPQELRGIVEQVRDGRLIISVPIMPGTMDLLKKGGFREVKTKEQVNDHTIFGNRVNRAIRIEGSDWRPFERAVGQEVIATIQATPNGGTAVTAVRPVR